MIQAPKIVTITGTPTIQSIDENFSTATTTKTTYQFNLFASSSNCGNNAQTVTYTLNINPKPRVEKGTPDGFSIYSARICNRANAASRHWYFSCLNCLHVSIEYPCSSCARSHFMADCQTIGRLSCYWNLLW